MPCCQQQRRRSGGFLGGAAPAGLAIRQRRCRRGETPGCPATKDIHNTRQCCRPGEAPSFAAPTELGNIQQCCCHGGPQAVRPPQGLAPSSNAVTAATSPLQPCSHCPDFQSDVQAAQPVGPVAGEGVQQMLLQLTEQVSRLGSQVDSLAQAAQTAPAAEEGVALQTQMPLKEVVQRELQPLLEQILHSVTTQMQPAGAALPAPAVLETVQQALTPHLEGMAARRQQLLDATASYETTTRHMLEHFAEQHSAQQQQLPRQLVHGSPTSSASHVALSRQLGWSHTSPASSSGGGCNALFLCWSWSRHGDMLLASLLRRLWCRAAAAPHHQ